MSVGIFLGTGYIFSLALPDFKEVFIISGSILGTIIGIFLLSWCFAAFICAVSDESIAMKDAFEKGWHKVWSFIWIFTLLGYIIGGGFLLFIIPGIIFSIWFFFSQYILAVEDVRGMNALLKSKEYVKGYWFDVFLRFLLIWIISSAISLVPFLGPFLSFFFFPFAMIFYYQIFEDLRSVKGDIQYCASSNEKIKWIGIATAGYLILPVFIIAILGTSFIAAMFLLIKAMKISGNCMEIFMR